MFTPLGCKFGRIRTINALDCTLVSAWTELRPRARLVRMRRAWLALLLPALARSEDYVAFKALSNTNLPPARALSATVLQHTVSANAALGRCVPSVA